ncbi:MAG TPA: bifunctional riboflavin kinase/FAD synthetase [Solirubrobacteraceae bacterium]|nr:bifunctional riboflavin kinase/FAD synthetase [Solirubrobacteraceae bacterium]
MQVTPLSDAVRRPRKIAVGEFDGVHVGHRAVIAGNDTVLTFEPHPLSVLRPHAAPKLLTSLEVKIALIERLGVRELVIVPFDDGFAHMGPAEFIDTVLVQKLGATHVSVGENFRFGHLATGTTTLLAHDGRFQARIVPLVEVDGATVSSTRIRKLVSGGDVERAARLLGEPFRLRGEVVDGDKRGRELGFPTANMVPDPAVVCPGNGVYACRVGERLAAVNVGVRPTFGRNLTLLVEAFLLDFKGDLYGQTLCVEFIKRLRGEERFEDVEALMDQMRRDVEATRELLA